MLLILQYVNFLFNKEMSLLTLMKQYSKMFLHLRKSLFLGKEVNAMLVGTAPFFFLEILQAFIAFIRIILPFFPAEDDNNSTFG